MDLIREIDEWIDDSKVPQYMGTLAQDWARVSKIAEELGEAVSELILWTGQNPRKPQDDEAYLRLKLELADVAITAIAALQHFTKRERETHDVLDYKLRRIYERMLTHQINTRGE
jgi:hypothetical protein